MRWVILTSLTLACSSAPTMSDAQQRRAVLVDSLVNPENEYSKLRLDHYATGRAGDWDDLPIWNPPAEPFLRGAFADPLGPLSADASAITIDRGLNQGDFESMRALGEEAFFRYPAQLADSAAQIHSEADAARHGYWIDGTRGVGGLVRVRTPDGATHVAYTCSTCHASVATGSIASGVPNDALDLGWGTGRVDVTTANGSEPVRIPDLRPVRFLTYLHHTASVKQKDVATLAVRLETLIITSNSQTVRPPREITQALATYVWSLAETLSSPQPKTDLEIRGEVIFKNECARCHIPPSYTGDPVRMDVVGTDPIVGSSRDRTTGNYRVPSLLGLKSRGFLLHDASVATLSEFLDPGRTREDYRSRLGAPIRGHLFGLNLAENDRASLVAFLSTL